MRNQLIAYLPPPRKLRSHQHQRNANARAEPSLSLRRGSEQAKGGHGAEQGCVTKKTMHHSNQLL